MIIGSVAIADIFTSEPDIFAKKCKPKKAEILYVMFQPLDHKHVMYYVLSQVISISILFQLTYADIYVCIYI